MKRDLRDSLQAAAADRKISLTALATGILREFLANGRPPDVSPLVQAVSEVFDESDASFTRAHFELALSLATTASAGGAAGVQAARELRSMLAALDADEDHGLGDLSTPV